MHVAAIENEDVLRAIAAGVEDIGALADRLDRRRDNMKRSIERLADLGVVTYPDLTLTDEGHRALAALDVAAGRTAPLAGFVGLLPFQIIPDPLNPRRDFSSEEFDEELDALRQDILQNGLLQNLVVRAAAEEEEAVVRDANGARVPMYRLISGERRWRASQAAIRDGDWPEDRVIPCQVIETDDLGHRLRALAENLQRRALNPVEEAQAFKALVDAGMTTLEISQRVSVTQRVVQQRLQLLQLEPNLLERMTLPKDDEDYLSVTAARNLVQAHQTADDGDGDQPEMFDSADDDAFPDWMLLAVAEIVHSYRVEGTHSAQIDPNVPPEAWQPLVDAGLIYRPDISGLDGRIRVQRAWSAVNALLAIGCNPQDEHSLSVAIDTLRARAGIDPDLGQRYSTAWLNGPYEPNEEGRKMLADRAARQAAQAAKASEEKRVRQEREAAIRQFRMDWHGTSATLLAFKEFLARVGLDGAWTSTGFSWSRNGKHVNTYDDVAIEAIAMAMNLIQGLPVEPPAPADDADDDAGEEE